MEIKLSRTMLASIDVQILKMRATCNILDVDKTAEIIRLEHINENVAREDIMDQLVLRSGSNAILEFNTPEFESDDILETIDGANVEFLLPLSNLKTTH
jgi:hypothetical protein